MDQLIIATRPPPPPASADGAQEEFLTIAATTTITAADLTRSGSQSAALAVTQHSSLSELCDHLRSPDPTYATIVQCLRFLSLNPEHDVLRASPLSSQLTKVLLERTFPDFWAVLERERGTLARCLGSPTGLGGIAARLKALIPLARNPEASDTRRNLGDLLDLLQMVLARADFIHSVWVLSVVKETEMKRNILWKEFATLVAGGRILSLAAEAETTLGRLTPQQRWVGDGKLYALWMGRQIAQACLKLGPDEANDAYWKAMSALLAVSFRLGYSDSVVDGLVHRLITRENDSVQDNSVLLRKLAVLLSVHDKRTFILSLLRVISSRHLQSDVSEDGDETWWKHDAGKVSGAAALLEKFVLHDEDYESLVLEWLTSGSGGGIGEPIALRRAIMVVLSHEDLLFRGLFEKLLKQFADKLWIKHTPIMRQEASVQILLLCAGIARRTSPSLLARLARSSNYLNGVSNHIASSSHRTRFLGMIVGEAFSALVDKDGKTKVSFEIEDMMGMDAKWWKSIPYIEDKIGDIKDLLSARKSVKKRKPVVAAATTGITTNSSAIQNINEQEEKEEEEEDEFMPYALPDSDTEDAPDEDATTIDRNKPPPPVYIRQLLSYLLSPDSYDKQLLALQHASALIRRTSSNTNTSKEVTSHLSPLAAALAGLDDRYAIPSFDEMRRDALTSLILASPVKMGPWIAHAFYTGDYGLSQRGMLLTSLGLAARELAGLEAAPPTQPSTQLPSHISSVWGSKHDPISALSSSLARTYLTPLALRAADTLTGPRVLKVHTFSSRLSVAARTSAPSHRKILDVAPYFLLPLTGGWSIAARDHGGSQPHADPSLLVHLLNTLSVILHAAGPAAPGLVGMTSEVLELSLSLRGTTDNSIREATLLAVLNALEVNLAAERGARGVAEEYGALLAEWKEFVERWVEGGEERTRALAAGVLVRIGEVEEGCRRALFGGLGVEE